MNYHDQMTPTELAAKMFEDMSKALDDPHAKLALGTIIDKIEADTKERRQADNMKKAIGMIKEDFQFAGFKMADTKQAGADLAGFHDINEGEREVRLQAQIDSQARTIAELRKERQALTTRVGNVVGNVGIIREELREAIKDRDRMMEQRDRVTNDLLKVEHERDEALANRDPRVNDTLRKGSEEIARQNEAIIGLHNTIKGLESTVDNMADYVHDKRENMPRIYTAPSNGDPELTDHYGDDTHPADRSAP